MKQPIAPAPAQRSYRLGLGGYFFVFLSYSWASTIVKEMNALAIARIIYLRWQQRAIGDCHA
jgi:hypothetical protein